MLRLPILLLALLVSPASASPPAPGDESASEADEGTTPMDGQPEQAPTPPRMPTPQEKLDEAVLNYQTSRHGLAMQQLAVLAIDPDIEASVRQDARVYLGEILYIQGDTEGAKRLFEQVLTEDPTYEIDRFRHPPDVCGHFEYVRTYIVPAVRPPPPVVVPPMPVSGYAPFAVYQFKHRTGNQWPLLITQAALGTTSLALFGVMLADGSHQEGDDAARQRLQTIRAVYFGTGVGFYGAWAWGSLSARRHWRVSFTASPTTDGVSAIGSATVMQ